MRRRARRLAALCWFAAWAIGCSDDALTQIVVVVDSDWDGFERVEIEIAGFEDEATVNARARAGDALLPSRVALVHEGGPLGPIGVTARGYVQGMRDPVLVEPRSGIEFERGRTRMLKIDLLFTCIGECDEAQACVEGPDCVASDNRRVTELAPWTGDVGELDVVFHVRDGDIVRRLADGGGVVPVQDAELIDGAPGPAGGGGGGGGAGEEGGTRSDADVEIDAGPVLPAPAFTYSPSNFDATAEAIADVERDDVVLDCGVSEFDSTTLEFSAWCGSAPAAMIVDQLDGSDAALLVMDTLTVAAGSVLSLKGSRPVILAVFGDTRIAGRVDASADGAISGPGADRACEGSAGSTGANTVNYSGAGGGSGGGFASAGGNGGRGGNGVSTAAAAVSGGGVSGNSTLTPLRGGCSGGIGGNDGNATGAAGGGGGGAVQISAAGRLDIYGFVIAAGGGGSASAQAQEGGGGGGSGGGILLEGAPLDIDGAAVIGANGGSGGAGQPPSGSLTSGAGSNGLASIAAAPGGSASGTGGEGGAGAARVAEAGDGSAGGEGAFSGAGGGGGGGGVGRIRVERAESCAVRGVFSPFASVGCAECGVCPGYPALGCTPLERTGRVYYVCEALAWAAARARCADVLLQLVRVDDTAENAFLAGEIAGDTWIGASDVDTEADWRWTDGTPFWAGNADGAPVAGRFDAWEDTQPDNITGPINNADCAVTGPDALWHDRSCSTEYPYACEQTP